MTDCNISTRSLPAEAQSREQETQGGAPTSFLGVIFGVFRAHPYIAHCF